MKLTTYIREARQELGKVLWPSQRTLTNHTILVIAVSVSIAAFIGVVDYLATIGFEKFLTLR
ncbi:MAG: preprotein translocase subunit SecE [bacterium]|nr:preprotein translocase subunit SecE [bacterium]